MIIDLWLSQSQKDGLGSSDPVARAKVLSCCGRRPLRMPRSPLRPVPRVGRLKGRHGKPCHTPRLCQPRRTASLASPAAYASHAMNRLADGNPRVTNLIPMHEAQEFLQTLTLVLCVAAVTTVVFQRLHQPVILGYLLAGMVVGPHIPVPLIADSHIVNALAELGVILLMFSLGIEFSLRKLARVWRDGRFRGDRAVQPDDLARLSDRPGFWLDRGWPACTPAP